MQPQPQYPPQQPQIYAPQQPPAYPPATPPAYPPQQPPAYPPAPQQPQYPPTGYPQQMPPGYQYPPQAPPGYQQQQAPPQAPVVAGTLDAYYSQPSTGGGKSLTFTAPGDTYTGIVTRPITNGDIAQQTDTLGRPAFFRDGRAKFVMKVPLQMQPSPAYPDGIAQWYVKGIARDELVRAMAEAGAPEGPPEAGAIITITMTGTRPSGPGMSPTKLVRVDYRRPQGAQPIAPAAPEQHYQPAPPPVYATNDAATNGHHHPAAAPPAPTDPARVNGGQPPAYAPPPPMYTPPAPVAAPPPPAAAPAELSDAQQMLLAQLTGQAT